MGFETDDPEFTRFLFQNASETFHPVSGIQIVDLSDFFVCRRMDMSADHPGTFPGFRKVPQLLLEIVHETDGGFDPRFDFLAEGEILFASPGAVVVVEPIDAEQHFIADRSDPRQCPEVGRDAVKAVPVDHQIIAAVRRQGVFLQELKPAKTDREKAGQHIIMVAPQVDDLGSFLLHLFQHRADKLGVGIEPRSSPAQGPAVDDVSIEDQALAPQGFQKGRRFAGFGVACPEVDVGQDDGAVERLFFHGGAQGAMVASSGTGRPSFWVMISFRDFSNSLITFRQRTLRALARAYSRISPRSVASAARITESR